MTTDKNVELLAQIKQYLEKEASTNTCADNSEQKGDYFDPSDYAGGNFDDCYDIGVQDGYIEQARDMLVRFFEDTVNEL